MKKSFQSEMNDMQRPVNVLAHQNVQDKIQLVMQQVSEQSFERRRVR